MMAEPDSSTPELSPQMTSMPRPPSVIRTKQDDKAEPHLLTLPRELRDSIYKYALCETHVEIKATGLTSSNGNLALTCKQLYNETVDLYYEHTTFTCGRLDGFITWFRGVPLKRLELVDKIYFRPRIIATRYRLRSNLPAQTTLVCNAHRGDQYPFRARKKMNDPCCDRCQTSDDGWIIGDMRRLLQYFEDKDKVQKILKMEADLDAGYSKEMNRRRFHGLGRLFW